jgi:rubrerythrin
MNMETVIFNGITVGQVLPWIAGAAVVWMLAKIYRALFAKKKVNLQHTVYFVCSHCGWEGNISKFGTRCPKCDTPTGDLQ